LRDNLGLFFLRVEQAIKADEERARQARETLSRSFWTVLSEDLVEGI